MVELLGGSIAVIVYVLVAVLEGRNAGKSSAEDIKSIFSRNK